MAEVLRALTSEEAKDAIDILYPEESSLDRFKKKVESKYADYIKKYKPFCIRCAKLDYKDAIETKVREIERNEGFIQPDKVKIKEADLDQYGDEKRFEFIKEQIAYEPIGKVDQVSMVRQVQIGVHRDYKCRIRGCGVSILVPKEEMGAKK